MVDIIGPVVLVLQGRLIFRLRPMGLETGCNELKKNVVGQKKKGGRTHLAKFNVIVIRSNIMNNFV